MNVMRRIIFGRRSFARLPNAIRGDCDELKSVACPASSFLSHSHQLAGRLLKLFSN